MTLTGANADHRLRGRQQRCSGGGGATGDGDSEPVRQARPVGRCAGNWAKSFTGQDKWITECAKDLMANKGKCLVLAGHRQPLAVHLMVNAINSMLGNVGQTIILHDAPEPKAGSIAELAKASMPARWKPGDSRRQSGLQRAGRFELGRKPRPRPRTSSASAITRTNLSRRTAGDLPLAHYLESWGDARTSDGTLVSVQPLDRAAVRRLDGNRSSGAHRRRGQDQSLRNRPRDIPRNRPRQRGRLEEIFARRFSGQQRGGTGVAVSSISPALPAN